MIYRAVLLAGLLSLGGRLLFAQVPAAERIPIRDPDRLQALGFPRDATNVYVWSKADLGGSRAKESANLESPETWGTGVGYSTVDGLDLQGSIRDYSLVRSPGQAYCFDNGGYPGGVGAYAQIQVPEGASLGVFRFWAYDSHPDKDLWFYVWETCQPIGYDPPTTTLITEGQTVGSSGQFPGSRSLNNLTANNQACSYSVGVNFALFGEDCQSTALKVHKLQFSWTRQVSPAPAVASFDDVPTDHPFFQFVEALAKSGITGGCGNGNYCPDQPLTRGQMAVFLAKALGLQWP
ncbi:MAG: S-layer homology domain-containing protein [Acidobacteriota bacterium]